MYNDVVYHLGRSFKSLSGHRRVTYRPDWSKATPWVAYYKGTAGLYFATLTAAQKYHQSFKDSLVINKD